MKLHFTKAAFLLLLGLLSTITNTSAQKYASGPQVLSFFSDADDTDQPYGLYLPPNYDENKKYPLIVMLHGAGSNHRLALRRVFGKSNAEGETDVEASRYFPKWDDVDFIVASVYARGTAGYQGIPEEDVYDMLDDVKRRFNIDENRISLTGLSMGGGGTLWIGLTRPDIWAAIAPVCPAPPAGTFELAANALNFPVHFFHGDADPVVPVDGTRKWVSHLQDIGVEVSYKEFVDVKHDSWVSAYDNQFIFEWFSHAERNPYPDRVRFVSKLYKYDKSFWVKFDKIDYGKLAEIDANLAKPNALQITTKNLDAFTLNLKNHPKFKPGNVSVELDGVDLSVKADSTFSFVKNKGVWTFAPNTMTIAAGKRKGAEGPILDAFSTRHVYVYGTADNPSPEELAKRMEIANTAANWSQYRGAFLGRIMFFPRVLADKEVRPSDLENSNLILFGTKETNSYIAKVADKLPLHLNPADKSHGLFYVFPMDKHYVAVNSGLPWWMGTEDQGYPFVPVMHRKLSDYKDFLLFKDSAKNIVADGYFTAEWKVPEEVKTKLSTSGAVNFTK
ncbi:carboxylesterase family protein [Dyadobacter aurulentus]|uniref:carboxylesterase family protein n=1 Tax=Dyadobacter sp. UC 10 TaxID=2605428 RepID=UPI0011F206BF|nr:alpha/beta hydrolase-fold protein [Dyadobacter sp. UC 10]KAA0989434.1 phospholipase [Dyadobacter sp. UC 10]